MTLRAPGREVRYSHQPRKTIELKREKVRESEGELKREKVRESEGKIEVHARAMREIVVCTRFAAARLPSSPCAVNCGEGATARQKPRAAWPCPIAGRDGRARSQWRWR
jgi:hypothetical protein